MSFEPVEEDQVWFKSKGKLYSLIKGSYSRAHSLLTGGGWVGLLYRVLVSGEGVEFSGIRHRHVPSARHSVSAHSLLLPFCLEVSCTLLHMTGPAKVRRGHLEQGTSI